MADILEVAISKQIMLDVRTYGKLVGRPRADIVALSYRRDHYKEAARLSNSRYHSRVDHSVQSISDNCSSHFSISNRNYGDRSFHYALMIYLWSHQIWVEMQARQLIIAKDASSRRDRAPQPFIYRGQVFTKLSLPKIDVSSGSTID